VHKEITDARNAIVRLEARLSARIVRLDERLGNYENKEVDKRLQLQVRIAHIEKLVGIPKFVA
jgi:hypothetical protein